MAILSGDEKALTVAPGIGKKIAQRVILELKDKLAKESAGFELPVRPGVRRPVGRTSSRTRPPRSACWATAAEINYALKGVDVSALSTEEIIKAALKNMMK